MKFKKHANGTYTIKATAEELRPIVVLIGKHSTNQIMLHGMTKEDDVILNKLYVPFSNEMGEDAI